MNRRHGTDYLISIANADVSREGERILHGISWRLLAGENWAFIGANGSGKSTLMKLIRGDLWPEPGKTSSRMYCLESECQETPLGIKKLIGLVDPELQDRYTRNCIDIPGEEVVLTGFFDSVWLQEKPSASMVRAARHLNSLLDLEGLRKRSILTMSRGEARKLLIARALVSAPRILLMDEIFSGLDLSARKQISGLLKKAIRGDTQFVLSTHLMADLGSFITHVALIKEGRIFRQGRRDTVITPDSMRKVQGVPIMARTCLQKVPATDKTGTGSSENGRYLIRIRRASVYMDDKNILRDIDWEMKAGENWVVLGRNGAGKSTFLGLISGRRRPASGGNIVRFGRGNPGSIWDIKKKIGYLSPEFQAEYDEDMTGGDVVLSGYFSSIGLYRPVTTRQRRRAEDLMRLLGIEKLSRRRVGRMSYGEFRKVLIARALVNRPALLLLDEPFSGLDRSSRRDLAQFIGEISRKSARVVLVSHHRDEIMPSISHVLVLDNGRIAAQGRKEEILRDDVLSALNLGYE